MSPEGRDAVRSRLKELQTVGALRIEGIRGESGLLNGRRWVIVSPESWAKEFPLSIQQGQEEQSQTTEKRVFRFSVNPTIGESNTKGLQVFKVLQEEAALATVNQSQSAAAPERKKRRLRRSGIVTWTPEDQEQAGLVEQSSGEHEILAAVQALVAAGKEPVPGLVQQQIQKQQLTQKKQDQQRAAEAAHAAALARGMDHDPEALAKGQQLIEKVRNGKRSGEATT